MTDVETPRLPSLTPPDAPAPPAKHSAGRTKHSAGRTRTVQRDALTAKPLDRPYLPPPGSRPGCHCATTWGGIPLELRHVRNRANCPLHRDLTPDGWEDK